MLIKINGEEMNVAEGSTIQDVSMNLMLHTLPAVLSV